MAVRGAQLNNSHHLMIKPNRENQPQALQMYPRKYTHSLTLILNSTRQDEDEATTLFKCTRAIALLTISPDFWLP